MKLPKTLKVFHKTYKLIVDDELARENHCYGITYHEKQETVLRERSNSFSEENEAEVFMHEVIHNIDAVIEIGLTEQQTSLLSIGLLTVIRDNDLDFRNDIS